MIKFLIKSGAKDSKKNMVLIKAVKNRDLTLVKDLLRLGIDVNKCDEYGKSALEYAFKNESNSIIDCLIIHGANIDFLDNTKISKNPLEWAIENNRAELAVNLSKKGYTIDCNYNKNIHIVDFVCKNQLEMAKFLLKKGSYSGGLDYKDKNGRTALSWAAEKGNLGLVQLLIDKGADISSRDKNKDTILMWAVRGNNPEIVKLLIEKNVDVFKRNKSSEKALDIAKLKGNKLMPHGALCDRENNEEILKILRNAEQCCIV